MKVGLLCDILTWYKNKVNYGQFHIYQSSIAFVHNFLIYFLLSQRLPQAICSCSRQTRYTFVRITKMPITLCPRDHPQRGYQAIYRDTLVFHFHSKFDHQRHQVSIVRPWSNRVRQHCRRQFAVPLFTNSLWGTAKLSRHKAESTFYTNVSEIYIRTLVFKIGRGKSLLENTLVILR